jgi:glycosyltransferase involved in cell wall biosynthesis
LDLVEHGVNGFVFEPFSSSDIAAALDLFIANKYRWKEFSAMSRSRIDDWGIGRFTASFLNCLRDCDYFQHEII